MPFKNMVTKTIVTIIVCCAAVFALQRLLKTEKNRDNKTFVVGTAAGYAPFVSINQQGDYEGFDIDIANAIVSKLNKKLELKDLGSMTSLMMALEQGSIDVIIWGMSITQDRLKKLAMVYYQGTPTLTYPLIFWQKIPAGIKSLNDMAGLTVCVEPSSAQAHVLSKYKNVVELQTEKVDDALLNLQYGKAVAALVDPAIAKKFKAKFPEIQILDIELGQDDQVRGMGIVIKQNNKNLIDQVQVAVQELKNKGVIETLEKKWGMV
ncbi:transporter substrate-binding domain-containing protein [Candidatus Babeliales bacterium]|nr:transporter substrate-binding domain-containing protein [Candidatus Babeliales bacterium]